jgi:hypothetical protein
MEKIQPGYRLRIDVDRGGDGGWEWAQGYDLAQLLYATKVMENLRENFSEHKFRLMMVKITVEEVEIL